MDIQQLRYFVRAAELGSLRAASEALHVSQPALSFLLRKLEDRYDVQLFDRHARGVTLTRAGKKLLPRAHQIIRDVESAEALLSEMGQEAATTITLGVIPTMERVIVPKFLQMASRQLPTFRFEITEAVSEELTALVDRGKLDLAFTFLPGDQANIVRTPLFREAMYLIGRPDNWQDDRVELTFVHLASYPLILPAPHRGVRQYYEALANENGIELNVTFETEASTLRQEILLTGGAFVLSARSAYQREISQGLLVAKKVVEPEIIRTIFLVHRQNERLGAKLDILGKLIQDLASEIRDV